MDKKFGIVRSARETIIPNLVEIHPLGASLKCVKCNKNYVYFVGSGCVQGCPACNAYTAGTGSIHIPQAVGLRFYFASMAANTMDEYELHVIPDRNSFVCSSGTLCAG